MNDWAALRAKEITPGAVHGRFVPGLPWDTLPPPIWEVPEGEPDPLADELRAINAEYEDACGEVEAAEEAVEEAEHERDRVERRLREKFKEYAKVAPGPAAALADELDLPE